MFHCVARKRPFQPRPPFRPATARIHSLQKIDYRKLRHRAQITVSGRRGWHKVEEPRGQLPRAALHATTLVPEDSAVVLNGS